MNNIDIWNIEFNIDNEQIIDNFLKNEYPLSLLNLLKSKNEYSIEEQIVYNIAVFHFNRMNISLDNSIFVEFWFKSLPDTDKFHLDCDEFIKCSQEKYVHPLLSCVTYLNDHNCPTILTNIDYDTYKYKEFEEQTSLFFSFPRFGKHITFEPTKFHGISNVFNNDNCNNPRYMLAINLWDKKPENLSYYNSIKLNEQIIQNNTIIKNISKIDNAFESIIVSNKIINFDLFERLLYYKEKNLFLRFS